MYQNINRTNSTHVETVVLLSKLDVDEHICIEIGEKELNGIAFSKDATYKEIKEFVHKKHGMNVTNLYIAQVKRKHGIIERANYNIAKKDNPIVPQCPPDKVRAIEDAFEWFGMT